MNPSMRLRNTVHGEKYKNRVARRHQEEKLLNDTEQTWVRLLNANPEAISFEEAKRLVERVNVGDWFEEMPGATRENWREHFKKLQNTYRDVHAETFRHFFSIRICPTCNAAFLATKSRKRKFCNDGCKSAFHNARPERGAAYHRDCRLKRKRAATVRI